MKNIFGKLLARSALALGLGSAPCASWALLPLEHWTQPDGVQVWLMNSPDIPMLDVQLLFDGGQRHEPPELPGLNEATVLMSAMGVAAQDGAQALDENALGERWADLGATFGAVEDADSFGYHLRTLTRPDLLEQAVQLAARQMAHPLWPQDAWQRERARWTAALQEAASRPGNTAGKAFTRALYGQHPYGHEATPEGLARITVADMAAWQQRMARPCRAKVALVGAIERPQAEALVQNLLAPLQQRQTENACPALPEVAKVAPLTQAQRLDIPFASAQAHILLGQPGISRAHTDWFAVLVGNHILGGGGFASLLTAEVREKRGLSYSVYSSVSARKDGGAFVIGLQTRPDQAPRALDVAQQTLARFLEQGPSEEQLQAAKDNLIGSFALRVDSNEKLLANLANIANHNLPPDYLERWVDQIRALDTAQVKAAMQRMIDPQRMVTVVLGAGEAAGEAGPDMNPDTDTDPDMQDDDGE